MVEVITTKAMVGRIIGTVTLRSWVKLDAPSMVAAS